MNLRKLFLNVVTIALFGGALSNCSSDSTDLSKKFAGTRYNVVLIRAVDANEWVSVTGTQEWWFFGGGVFRQIGSNYVEPQFYGANQACNGSGSGTYEMLETESRKIKVTLKYDGVTGVSGLCRMTDRSLEITLQPSGVVDMLDNKRVQRLERLEPL